MTATQAPQTPTSAFAGCHMDSKPSFDSRNRMLWGHETNTMVVLSVPTLDLWGSDRFYTLKVNEESDPIYYADAVANDIIEKMRWNHLFNWPGQHSAHVLEAFCRIEGNKNGSAEPIFETVWWSLHNFCVQAPKWEGVSEEDTKVYEKYYRHEYGIWDSAKKSLMRNKRERDHHQTVKHMASGAKNQRRRVVVDDESSSPFSDSPPPPPPPATKEEEEEQNFEFEWPSSGPGGW